MQDLATRNTKTDLAVAESIFGAQNNEDLIAGAEGGFGVVSIKGSKWRIKFGGEDQPITDSEGEMVPSIPVVLIKASAHISKVYYSKQFEEGVDQAPDCMSIDGTVPDAGVPFPQADQCSACPHNVWGSKITESGKKSKACADSRRMAIVPAAVKKADADPEVLLNESYGGPMLLRVPPASLQDLAKYGRELINKHNMSYAAVVTRIGFDPDAAYPKLTFKALRPLTDEEKEVVVSYYETGAFDAILHTAPEMTEAAAAPAKAQTVDADFEEDEEPAKAAPAKPAVRAATPAKPAARPATPAKPAASSDEMDIDGMLEDLNLVDM
jgi:hypothetical protein